MANMTFMDEILSNPIIESEQPGPDPRASGPMQRLCSAPHIRLAARLASRSC